MSSIAYIGADEAGMPPNLFVTKGNQTSQVTFFTTPDMIQLHGQNDHVVHEGESRQIYESMKKNGKEAVYILFPDEGHRPAKFSNKWMYLDRAEQFLSYHLKGKYQPVEKKVLASSSAKMHH